MRILGVKVKFSVGHGKFNFPPLYAEIASAGRIPVTQVNLVPRAFLRRGEDGREKTLASADHVIFKHPEKLGVIN